MYTPRGMLEFAFPLIVNTMLSLKCRSCLIDGEAVVTDLNGVSDFEMLRSRRHDHHAFLHAFDLVELNGRDLRGDSHRGLQGCAGRPPEGRWAWPTTGRALGVDVLAVFLMRAF